MCMCLILRKKRGIIRKKEKKRIKGVNVRKFLLLFTHSFFSLSHTLPFLPLVFSLFLFLRSV